MSNSFQSFSPDSFEQFIRVASLHIFGDGVEVFGNGPDGGREAVFRGEVNFPFENVSKWDGYGVIQAKFKERLENTKADQDWAANQLRLELKKWVDNENRSPKPDYFVFCINVELTSGKGGALKRLKKFLKSSQRN